MINRKNFFDRVRLSLFNGRMTAAQVTGITEILNRWERIHATEDDRMLAYILATVYHETDKKMSPIEEYGKGRGLRYGVPAGPLGLVYYGRGLVQLTWLDNYRKMSTILGVDLVSNPGLLLDLDISIRVLFVGMFRGTFTGKKLSDYFSSSKEDWVGARRIINGTDKAQLIAGHARRFYDAISYTVS